VDGRLGFIQYPVGPAHPEKLGLCEGENEISLQRTRQYASIHKCGEAVGEHSLDQVRIEFRQLGQSLGTRLVPLGLVAEEILRLDPAMSARRRETDHAAFQ
jgi:hypothetical protein